MPDRPLPAVLRTAAIGLAAAALAAAALPAVAAQAAPDDPPAGGKAFNRLATYPVYKNLPKDVPASSETVAEISDVSPDGKTLVYTDALGKRAGFLDISDPSDPAGIGSLSLATLGDADDQPTSVAVVGKYVLVVVDTSETFIKPSGRVDVVRLADSKRVRSIDLEGQPDSIDISPDGTLAAIAMENQRDEEATPAGRTKGDLPQLPAGFVQKLSLSGSPADWTAERIDLVNPDGTALPSFVDAGLYEPTDPEPEYVSINADNKLALTLQENNGVAIIDLPTGDIDRVFTAGTVSGSGFDIKKDGKISLTDSLTDVPREPDAINWVDDTHVATANEGDLKGGSRGWSIFDASTGQVTWDAGNTFEKIAVRHGLYNDDRAAKKGAEPEGIAISTIGGTKYAFVGSERSNFVAVYDLTDPAAPEFLQALPTTNGPEGILPIPGRNLLAVSSETDDAAVNVRSSVTLFELGEAPKSSTSIVSDDIAGAPIGWSALGALSAKPGDPDTLYTAADTVLKPAQIFTLDVKANPARITSATTVTQGGAPANLDIEGIFARPEGGFWVASEGATGPANKIYRLDPSGAIVDTVSLPTDISSHIKNWGLEGVTATSDADGEHVWTVIQRQLWIDPADQTETLDGDNIARIGRYDVADGTWHWFGYELQSPKRDDADWVGLSEITAVDDDTFAVIERDKLNGPQARNKRIYTVDLPADTEGAAKATDDLPILTKELAIDVLKPLRATNGWTQEKLEGFTIAADGALYGVTDNDGLKDATGETVFLRLGQAGEVFGDALSSTTSLTLSKTKAPYGEKLIATVQVDGGAGVEPGGTVQVRDGATVLGEGAVSRGAATITLDDVPVGARTLVAHYSGDARTAAGTSEGVAVTISRAATSTVLVPSASTVKKNATLGMRVRVSGTGFAPTGFVEIKDGSKLLRKVAVKGDAVAITVKLTTKGKRTLRAYYRGSEVALTSSSATRTITVK